MVVFGFQSTLDSVEGVQLIRQWGLVPYYISELRLDSVSTLFTSMFLHDGWVHLVSNMWFLHIFGDNVEDVCGRWRFLVFYLMCGLAAGLAHTLSDSQSQLPMVGASGCIAGVMAAYLVFFPNSKIVAFALLLVRVPAVFFIVFWFVLQVLLGFGSLQQFSGEGVAVFAHIGGFLMGLYLLIQVRQPAAPRPRVVGEGVPRASRLNSERLGERC